MPEMPLHMLTHRVQVEPALPAPWGGFGAAFEMRCLVVLHNVGRLRKGGQPVQAEANLYAQLGENCPTGSRVTLHDGRVGYVSEANQYEAGGLPTPDHYEGVWTSEKAVAPPAGETVVLLIRALLAEKDRYGNDRYTSSETAVAGCQVAFRSSTENDARGGEQVTDVVDVVFPPGTVAAALDKMRVRGKVYDIQGEPQPDLSPMTGVEGGLVVTGRRVH